jgi:hypothetical protein
VADRVEIALRLLYFVFTEPAGDIGKREFGQSGHDFARKNRTQKTHKTRAKPSILSRPATFIGIR